MKHWHWIPLLIGTIVISLFGVYAFMRHRRIRENFQNSTVTFMTAQEVQRFLVSDEDGYVNSFTPMDLHARKVSSKTEYVERISSAATDVAEAHKTKIRSLAHAADVYLIQAGYHKLAAMPWKIAVTSNAVYENGYPHTRKNIIFLSTNELDSIDLGRTLVHEKVHVYQRMYPDDMQTHLRENNYKPWKLRKDEPYARSNPDLDDWIYIDMRTQKPMIAYYTSSKPSSISDVRLEHPSYEHPYEKMAYDIAGGFH